MRTAIPEKILKIIEDINTQGNASLTRLTVLKKWFEAPGRLSAFGLWLARRAAGRKGKTKDAAGALLDETRALLGTSSTRESLFQQIDQAAAENLHNRARDFHNSSKTSNGDRCGSSTAGRCCWWSKGWRSTSVSNDNPATAINWRPTGPKTMTRATATD
jgi:hypothetical protein